MLLWADRYTISWKGGEVTIPNADSEPGTAGWILPLTADAFDLDRPEHVSALRQAYDRFGRVGRAQ
jgi:hypothetical protein